MIAKQPLFGCVCLCAATLAHSGDVLLDDATSIGEQQRLDLEQKDYLFKLPGADAVFGPWSDLRARLAERHGFKPSASVTHLYQNASDVVGAEDDASGYEFVVDGTWEFLGRDTGAPTVLGFEFLYRNFSSDVPPVALFTQVGSLYPTTVAFGKVETTVGQFWVEKQNASERFAFRVGKLFPISAYDFFPLKNFRTDFVDGIHGANFVIPLPDRGLGGYVTYRPRPNVYLRAGFHDANADAEEWGFDSLFDEGELFTIFEIGFDPQLAPRQPGRPPPGDVHLSVWRQDEREEDTAEAWGFAVSASQRFGRYLPFVRYGYMDIDSDGRLQRRVGSTLTAPTPVEHQVNVGFAYDGVFGQSSDRIGIGATWARPADGSLDNQGALDVFYRVQVTPRIAITPLLHLIFDPVRNPDEDQVWVFGIRSRFFF